MDQVFVIASVSDHCSELLQRPGRTRVCRHVQVRQAARAVLDDDEHVQHPKRRRDGDEEVAREDGRGLIPQERRPAQVARRSLRQVLAHGSWRDPNPQLAQQFVGDPLFAPQHVLPGHPADQLAQFYRDRWSTGPGLHSPEQSPAGAVPADHRRRLHDHQRVTPIEEPCQ